MDIESRILSNNYAKINKLHNNNINKFNKGLDIKGKLMGAALVAQLHNRLKTCFKLLAQVLSFLQACQFVCLW